MKKQIQFAIEHEVDDQLVEHSCTCEIDYYEEDEYGADADGNRGVLRAFIEEIEIVRVFSAVDGFITLPDMSEYLRDCITGRAESKFYE